jgi:hypothetical protein
MAKMTREEIIEAYGNIRVKFSSYYKYTFYFRGETLSGLIISAWRGGDSDSIYKFEVDEGETYSLAELCPNNIEVRQNGILIAEYEEELF